MFSENVNQTECDEIIYFSGEKPSFLTLFLALIPHADKLPGTLGLRGTRAQPFRPAEKASVPMEISLISFLI